MKKYLLPGCVLAGVLGGFLHGRHLLTQDGKGLLAAGHPFAICAALVTVLAVAAAVLLTGRDGKPLGRSKLSTALRALAMAVGCLQCMGTDRLGNAAAVAGALAAALTLLSLWQPGLNAWGELATVLFFPLCLLSRYRIWSAEPEIARYFYSLAALVLTMLGAYQRFAAGKGMAKGGLFRRFGCLGLYFCLVAAADPGYGLLFGALALWLVAELGASQ